MAATVYGGGPDLKDFAANYLGTYRTSVEDESRRRDNNAQTSRDMMQAMIERQRIKSQETANKNANLVALLNASSQRNLENQRMTELARQFDLGLKSKETLAKMELDAQKELAKSQKLDPRFIDAILKRQTDVDVLEIERKQMEEEKKKESLSALGQIRSELAALKKKRTDAPAWYSPESRDKARAKKIWDEGFFPIKAKADTYGLVYDPVTEDFVLPGANQPAPIPLGVVQPNAVSPIPVAPVAVAPPVFSMNGQNAPPQVVVQPQNVSPDVSSPEFRRAFAARIRQLINQGLPMTNAADIARQEFIP